MSLHTLQTLARLVKEGMILVGSKPQNTLGLLDGEKEDEFTSLINQIWEHPNVYERKIYKLFLISLTYTPTLSIVL